jgi:SAM-dependent methyltransferase
MTGGGNGSGGEPPVPPFDRRWYARAFDLLGSHYDDYPFTHGSEQEVSFLVGELGLEPPARVLDVGCGTGRHALELAARGFVVTAVDLSYRLLEIGLERARKRDVLVNFVHADARDLTFDGSYDVALSLCQGAFGLLEDDDQNRRVLERMRAALKPGGCLVLSVVNRRHVLEHRDRHPGHDAATGYTDHVERWPSEAGPSRLLHYRDRAFFADEIAASVTALGFEVKAVFGSSPGDFGRHPVAAERPELLLIAGRG